MYKRILRILLKHYTKIGHNGGISKVIFDDEFEEIAEEIVKLLTIPDVRESLFDAKINKLAFKKFPRLIDDHYNPQYDSNKEYRDVWVDGCKSILNSR